MCYRLHILNSLQLIRLFYSVAAVSLSLSWSLPTRAQPSPPFILHLKELLQHDTLCVFFSRALSFICFLLFDQPLNCVVSLRWPSLHHSASVWLLSLISLHRCCRRCCWWWVSLGHILRKRKARGFIRNIQTAPPLLPTSPHSIRISATLAR